MKQFINKFFSFFLAFVLILFLRLYLSFYGFGNLVKMLEKKRSNMLDIDKLSYIIKSIEITSSIIPNITCLIKAAALKIVFNKEKNLSIIIGIRKNKINSFESHAWVSYGNNVILNSNSKIPLYKVIYTIK